MGKRRRLSDAQERAALSNWEEDRLQPPDDDDEPECEPDFEPPEDDGSWVDENGDIQPGNL